MNGELWVAWFVAKGSRPHETWCYPAGNIGINTNGNNQWFQKTNPKWFHDINGIYFDGCLQKPSGHLKKKFTKVERE